MTEQERDSLRVVEVCRAQLKDLTPLKRDCGRLCGAACCASLPGEESGMLLFPMEEALYKDKPDYRLVDSPAGKLLICSGSCHRDDRPLACRLFPLLPLPIDGHITPQTDRRAYAVCPLAVQGTDALDSRFVQAVKDVGLQLWADPLQKAFLQQLAEEQEALQGLF